jgi:Fe2+ or Zn2+ uptake regulation protein
VACNRVRQGGCHHPVICDGCGRIDEVEGDDVGPVERRLDARGWRITGHVIEFRGLCPACTALKAASGTGAAAARG